jgi:hypothetical protein
MLVKHGSESLEKLGDIKRKYGLSGSEEPPIVAGEFKGLSGGRSIRNLQN